MRALWVGAGAAIASTWIGRVLRDVPQTLGASKERIAEVAEGSPQYRGGTFHNAEPARQFVPDADPTSLLRGLLTRQSAGGPQGEVPLEIPELAGPPADLAVTWFGHSSVLVEVDGYRVLTDPVWSDRCSPSRVVGPHRQHPVPVELSTLPALDAVVISHDHYDHLDMDSIIALTRSQNAVFVVPLGVGAHLRGWGVSPTRVIELDWDQSHQLGKLTLTCTQARHFSGRSLTRNTTLWASWVIAGPQHKVFFGGDTGYTKAFKVIGDTYGPFDLTLLPVGAYNTQWPDIHMNPEEAVQSHTDLNSLASDKSAPLLPIHWATFNLALHPWAEPIERALSAASEQGVTVMVLKPGQRTDVRQPAAPDGWWRLS
ncbi:MBL fold metallo-hydrolase [Mycobacteroides franklinii]|uniref:MBL fold metallo-hydrolase n=1 Tax=Mycobacteroides franklinii TaxID=948102 RepID=UPI00099222C9|nr:MBL fold metallo-hydrolase [Mycobacteroides franklinii]